MVENAKAFAPVSDPTHLLGCLPNDVQQHMLQHAESDRPRLVAAHLDQLHNTLRTEFKSAVDSKSSVHQKFETMLMCLSFQAKAESEAAEGGIELSEQQWITI